MFLLPCHFTCLWPRQWETFQIRACYCNEHRFNITHQSLGWEEKKTRYYILRNNGQAFKGKAHQPQGLLPNQSIIIFIFTFRRLLSFHRNNHLTSLQSAWSQLPSVPLTSQDPPELQLANLCDGHLRQFKRKNENVSARKSVDQVVHFFYIWNWWLNFRILDKLVYQQDWKSS